MTKFIALAALCAVLPATAGAQEINQQARIGQAVRAGCHIQQVNTPAGKLVHSAPNIHCPAGKAVAAATGAGGGTAMADTRTARAGN